MVVPDWAKAVGTFGLGIASGAFGAGMFMSDLRSTATVASDGVKAHELRISSLEREAAAREEAFRSMKEQMTEMRADVKELLRRVK